jgi:hypothetical protein
LEVDEGAAVDVAQQFDLFRVKGLAPFPEEFGLVNLVAVVGCCCRIPGYTVGFVVFFFNHCFPQKRNLTQRRKGAKTQRKRAKWTFSFCSGGAISYAI